MEKKKRGTSAYREADTGERKGLPGEKAKEWNQRQGNGELQKKGSLILFMEVMAQNSYSWNCPKLSCFESVLSMRHIANKLERKRSHFILMFENKTNSSGSLKNLFITKLAHGLNINCFPLSFLMHWMF